MLAVRMVLDVDRGDPRLLEGLHRAPEVRRVVQAAFRIGDHRHAHRIDDGARLLRKFGHRQRAGVGNREAARRGGVAADVHAVEAVRLDQLRRQRVGGAEYRYRFSGLDEAAQLRSARGNNYDPGPEFRPGSGRRHRPRSPGRRCAGRARWRGKARYWRCPAP